MKTKIIAVARWCLLRLPGGRHLYNVLVAKRRAREELRNRLLLQTVGWDVLDKVHETLKEKVAYFADYGTLLGLMRDGQFIAHDNDMDFGVMPGESPARLLRLLIDAGFKFRNAYEYEGRICEFAVLYRGLHMDFFFDQKIEGEFYALLFYKKDGVRYPSKDTLTAFRIRRPAIPYVKEIEIRGHKFNCPENYEDIFLAAYGSNWRTPIQDCHAGEQGARKREELAGFAKFKVPAKRVYELG